MHTMVKELLAFETAGSNVDVHVKLQRLEGAIAQAANTVVSSYGDKARAWHSMPGVGAIGNHGSYHNRGGSNGGNDGGGGSKDRRGNVETWSVVPSR
jgi:hypothetical protein